MRTAAGTAAAIACLVACCLIAASSHRGRDELLGHGRRRVWPRADGVKLLRRGQRLAYDGMYDTPPVTWYYPAQENSQNTLGYTYNNAQYQSPEVVYTPTSYDSAPTSMSSSPTPWWKDMKNENTETHYEFSGTSIDGKVEARAVPEENFWQNQPGTDGAVRFSWGDDGHR